MNQESESISEVLLLEICKVFIDRSSVSHIGLVRRIVDLGYDELSVRNALMLLDKFNIVLKNKKFGNHRVTNNTFLFMGNPFPLNDNMRISSVMSYLKTKCRNDFLTKMFPLQLVLEGVKPVKEIKMKE